MVLGPITVRGDAAGSAPPSPAASRSREEGATCHGAMVCILTGGAGSVNQREWRTAHGMQTCNGFVALPCIATPPPRGATNGNEWATKWQ